MEFFGGRQKAVQFLRLKHLQQPGFEIQRCGEDFIQNLVALLCQGNGDEAMVLPAFPLRTRPACSSLATVRLTRGFSRFTQL